MNCITSLINGNSKGAKRHAINQSLEDIISHGIGPDHNLSIEVATLSAKYLKNQISWREYNTGKNQLQKKTS